MTSKIITRLLVTLAVFSLPVVITAAATGSDTLLWVGVGMLAIVTIFHKKWCSVNK